MSGTKMHREVRLRPGGGPRPGPMQNSRLWMNAPTKDAVGSKTANTTGNSVGDAATETDATLRRLVKLHPLSNSRKGSLNATYKNNTDANDKAFDLNQKSLHALDALAAEYVAFEATMANVTSEHEAGDVFHAATLAVAEEIERCQKDQGRPQDDLDCSCDDLAAATKEFSDCWAAHEATGVKLCNAFREVCNRRATHEVIYVDAKKALHRTFEIKRKASEIQEGVATHRERTRRVANEHVRAEGHANDGVGSLGRALQAAAKATHSLTCGVPNRESNEIKYLREATELIEAWQHQLLSGQAMSGPPSEHSEVI